MDGKEIKGGKPKMEERLEDAVKSSDAFALTEVLREINSLLIGSEGSYVGQQKDYEKFVVGQEKILKVYLGDGGMSRLLITRNGENIEVRVSDVSMPEVKQKWQEIK